MKFPSHKLKPSSKLKASFNTHNLPIITFKITKPVQVSYLPKHQHHHISKGNSKGKSFRSNIKASKANPQALRTLGSSWGKEEVNRQLKAKYQSNKHSRQPKKHIQGNSETEKRSNKHTVGEKKKEVSFKKGFSVYHISS